MSTFIPVPRKYVKLIRSGQGKLVTYSYELPEVEEFLRENDMNQRAIVREDWVSGSFGVSFMTEEDAVIFKLAFL